MGRALRETEHHVLFKAEGTHIRIQESEYDCKVIQYMLRKIEKEADVII